MAGGQIGYSPVVECYGYATDRTVHNDTIEIIGILGGALFTVPSLRISAGR
jgi:hypothetical protein